MEQPDEIKMSFELYKLSVERLSRGVDPLEFMHRLHKWTHFMQITLKQKEGMQDNNMGLFTFVT